MSFKKFQVNGDKKVKFSDFDTGAAKSIKSKKESYQKKTQENLEKIARLQEKLYSSGQEGLVIVLQAMDAGGKDGTIKHVMSGVNPQGIDVYSFKAPTSVELAHDYMWRIHSKLPERGKIAIFNRSYYEDVLIVKVRKLYENYKMPERCKNAGLVERRYKHIKDFEEFLYDEGFRTIKIFLHLSKDEQKRRFLERIDQEEKNWKFSSADIKERAMWDDYQDAYEDAVNATASRHSPWFILPADNKWYTRYLVSEVVLSTLEKIDPQFPELPKEERARLAEDRELLLKED